MNISIYIYIYTMNIYMNMNIPTSVAVVLPMLSTKGIGKRRVPKYSRADVRDPGKLSNFEALLAQCPLVAYDVEPCLTFTSSTNGLCMLRRLRSRLLWSGRRTPTCLMLLLISFVGVLVWPIGSAGAGENC